MTENDSSACPLDLVVRMRLQAEDLHVLNPASETVKCLSLGADKIERLRWAIRAVLPDDPEHYDERDQILADALKTPNLEVSGPTRG